MRPAGSAGVVSVQSPHTARLICDNCTQHWGSEELDITTAYRAENLCILCILHLNSVQHFIKKKSRSGAIIFSVATLARRNGRFLQHMVRETWFPGEEKPSLVEQTKARGRAAFPQCCSSSIQQPEQAAMQHKSVLVWGAGPVQSTCLDCSAVPLPAALQGEENTGGRRKGSVHLRCVLLKCVFNMETESSMLQKKNQAAFNIYIFRNQLCRNRQSASLENLFLPSLEKTQDKLLRGRQNRERREKSKHSSYHTQVVLFLQSWISHPYLNTQSHQGLVFPRHKANRLLCFLY